MFSLRQKQHPEYIPEDILFVKRSLVQGRGLFTWRPLAKGTLILKLSGPVIEHDYTPEFSAEGPNWIGIGYRKWIVTGPEDKAIYLNHSCDPNVIFTHEHNLISLRPMQSYEELVLDYSTTELDPYWQMDCRCGAANCRKKLRSFQFLPDELKNKYKPFLHTDFWGEY